VRPARITVLKDVPPGNGSWLVELPGGRRAVLRRYHPGASPEDLGYEHAVLGYLADAGWAVPDPVGDPVCHGGLWYCLTRYLPAGQPPAKAPRSGGGGAVTWPGCTWRCVTLASGSGSVLAGGPSTARSPPSPAWTGRRACGD
jgi:hypothetical protein